MGQLSVIGSIALYISCFGLAGVLSKTNIKSKFIKLFLVIVPPVILATFRYNVGYDYGSYIEGYNNSFQTTYESIIASYKVGDPIAYYLITKFATTFNSERIYLMILALFSLIPAVFYILREWKDKNIRPMIIFIYMFSPFIFSFSACKQGIALSILMFSLKYVYDRKLLKFTICVVIACLFHSTALVSFPVYFFLNRRGNLSTIKKVLIIVVCLIIIMNLQLILGSALDGRYEIYATNIVEGKNRTFWLYSLLTIIFLLFEKKFIELDKRNELLIMMMVIGVLCQYLGFSNAFTKRIGEYFLMAQVFLIPQCIYLFTKDSRRILKGFIVIYVVAIFLISTPIAASGMGFVPYQFKIW